MEGFVYDEHLALEGSHWWFCGRRDYINRVMQLFIKPIADNLSLCEIGSGTGGNLPMLTAYGSVDCVEMNDDARGFIKAKDIAGVDGVFAGHLPENISLPQRYDAICSLDVIEHVADDLAGLREISEHLEPHGKLVITVPAYQWLWSSHDVANHHHRRYTKTQICRVINEAGYQLEYASYFNSILFPLAALARLLEKLTPKALRSKSQTQIKMPAKVLNRIFYSVFSIESRFAGKFSMPFGLSIMVVAKKHE